MLARLTGLARAGKELVPQREQTKKKMKQQRAEGQRATLARAPKERKPSINLPGSAAN